MPTQNRRETITSDYTMTRRHLLASGIPWAVGATLLTPRFVRGQPANSTSPKIKTCLTPGSIGVAANQLEAMELAARFGFDAVEPFGNYLASLSDQEIGDVADRLKSKNLQWGAAGLPVDFRGDNHEFAEGLENLPSIAMALEKAGVTRVGTWLMPGHDSLTYLQNLKQHAARLSQVGRVLKDHGQRLGLEYVGTFSLRNRFKYPFVHTLAETLDLCGEIGTGNVGLVLDSWHWWQAGDSVDEIASLANEQVVSVDLNDAPANVPKEEQIDGQRELPVATGVIDVQAFLGALKRIEYDGPMRAEPFNRTLNALENDAACAAVSRAMKAALKSVE